MSKLLLQSKDVYQDLLELDTNTGKTRLFKRSQKPDILDRGIMGSFAIIEGIRLLLYRLKGVLFFQIGDEDVVKIDEDIESYWEESSSRNRLEFVRGSDVLSRFEYDPSKLKQPIPSDPTAYIDIEDFDFCLFVHRVLSTPDRRRHIYGGY